MKKEHSERLAPFLEKAELSPEELQAFQEIVLSVDEENLESIIELVEKDQSWIQKLGKNLLDKRAAVSSGDAESANKILEQELADLQSI